MTVFLKKNYLSRFCYGWYVILIRIMLCCESNAAFSGGERVDKKQISGIWFICGVISCPLASSWLPFQHVHYGKRLSVFTDHRFSYSACGISRGGLHTVSQEEKVITMKQYKTGGHTIFRDDGEKTADLKVCDNKYPLPMRRRMKFGK